MKILALQLKRIGDLILTTPALRRLRQVWPDAHITLGVMDGTAALLPAIPQAHAGVVFGRGRGFVPWQQAITGGWDICLDFTGNDRSASATALSRATKRVAFEAVRKNKLRALAYNTWSPSLVREVHTAQHYLDLAESVAPANVAPGGDILPELSLPASETDRKLPTNHSNHTNLDASHSCDSRDSWSQSAVADSMDVLSGAKTAEPASSYALLHPGTARPEKYWLADRWSAVAAHLHDRCGLRTIFTSGPDPYERAHVAQASPDFQSPPDLLALAALVAGARLVVSCDTAVVHLAAAFRVPQMALFGPTNPFHWRPMHERAVVLSAAQPGAPLTKFTPRMKGAPMDRISTEAVIHAIDSLLAPPRGAL